MTDFRTVLKDPFDEFYPFRDDTHLTIPVGWGLAWKDEGKPGPVRPECQKETIDIDQGVRSPPYGAKIAHAFAFFDASLWKSFTVEQGRKVRVSVWTTAEIQGDGLLACRIGIDPYGSGGGDAWDDQIIWSDWRSTANEDFVSYKWRSAIIECVADSDQITVFLHAKADHAIKTNAAFFDDFMLEVEVVDTPEDPPPPIGGTLLQRIDTMDAIIGVLQIELAELRIFVTTGTVTALVVE